MAEIKCETASFSDLDLYSIPMRAANYSARLSLSKLLNIEQTLPNSKQLPKDYRGLAELMGFEYTDIRNFQQSREPTGALIEAWECKPGSSVGALLEMLQQLERFDILDEVRPILEANVKKYVGTRQSAKPPLQVAEISSCRPMVFPPDNPDYLTLNDSTQGIQFFDAYVCYADNDLEFVKILVDNLEGPGFGIKLCIRERDLLAGILQYDAFVKLIEQRCNRVLVIISPDFISSPESEFQAKFAAGLAIEQRSNKIIPIICKPCSNIPSILSCLSKVDLTRPLVQDWAWRKIISSLKAPRSQSFVSQQQTLPPLMNMPQLQLPSSEIPCETSSLPIVEEYASETISVNLAESFSAMLPNSAESGYSTLLNSSATMPNSAESGSATPPRRTKWFQNFKNRFNT